MAVKPQTARRHLQLTLGLSSAISLVLFIGRVVATNQPTYWFLVWNLFLAWVPLGFAWWLIARLNRTPWLSLANILLSLLWLGFLPNAFYISSDLIHLARHTGSVSLLYDVVMFLSFTFNGFLLGFLSLFGIQAQLKKRVSGHTAGSLVAVVLVLCSFAIYLGRYLRWNSWDIVVSPAGLIFDVSDPFINPGNHPQVFTTTLMFFVLLGSIYLICYQLVAIAKQNRD